MLQILLAILLLSPCLCPNATAQQINQSEDIKIFLSFDLFNFTQFLAITRIEIRAINLNELNSSMPEKYVYADEIRENLTAGNFSLSDIERAYIDEISENTSAYLSKLFGNNCTLSKGWDEKSLQAEPEPPVDEPPIVYYINYTVKPWFGQNIDDELIIGILNDGAIYTINFNPLPAKYPTILNLTLPFGTAVPNFPYPTNGTIQGRHYYSWDGWRELKMSITGAFARPHKESEVNISVLIDMHTLANEAGNEYLYTSINISAEVHVLPMPRELELPENFEMPFIGADAIRLVIAKQVVNLSYIYEALNATVEAGKEKLAEMFNNRVDFKVNPIENLTWEGEVTKMDGEPPVRLSFSGNTKLDFGEYIKNYRQALALTYTYQMNLPAIEGFNITYTIVFPKNVEVVHVECTAKHEKIYVNGREGVAVQVTNASEMLKIMIRISFDIDFERLYPFLVLIAILTGIWIGVSILAWKKKRSVG